MAGLRELHLLLTYQCTFECDHCFVWGSPFQTATMTLPYIPGKTFTGRVEYIYPYVNMDSRDVTVRLEFLNPELELKPMMYANGLRPGER